MTIIVGRFSKGKEAAYEPEDLPGAIEEAMKRQKEKGKGEKAGREEEIIGQKEKGKGEKGGREGTRSPMLDLVAKAMEEFVKRKA